jgi:hypothetical protein
MTLLLVGAKLRIGEGVTFECRDQVSEASRRARHCVQVGHWLPPPVTLGPMPLRSEAPLDLVGATGQLSQCVQRREARQGFFLGAC